MNFDASNVFDVHQIRNYKSFAQKPEINFAQLFSLEHIQGEEHFVDSIYIQVGGCMI